MSKRKTTKRNLVSSVISLIICVSMLIGTTFAWFTDSVSSGVNRIQAGNLDIEVKHTNATINEPITIQDKTDLFVDGEGNQMEWEPGAMSWETFTVSNEGNLALKYNLKLAISKYNTVKDTNYSLKDVLKVKVLTGENVKNNITRQDVAAMDWSNVTTSIDSFQKEETILLPKTSTGTSSETFQVIVYWQPTDDDNKWNVNNGKQTSDNSESLYIEFGINVNASQVENEYDSFGNDYDKKAQLAPIEAAMVPNEDKTEYKYTDSSNKFTAKYTPSDSSDTSSKILKVTPTAVDSGTVIIDDGMEAIAYDVTLYKQTTGSDGTVTNEELQNSGLTTVTIDVGAGRTGVVVYHNSDQMNKVSTLDEVSDGKYYYDTETGRVTFATSTFSPFTIAYDGPVAMIGTTAYYDLQKALDQGGEILLLKDVSLENKVYVTKDTILNMGDYTLTKGSNGNNETICVGYDRILDDGATEDIKFVVNANNGGIVSSGRNNDCIKVSYWYNYSADITINGGKYSSENAYFIELANSNAQSKNKLKIEGDVTVNTYKLINISGASDVSMVGGSFTTRNDAVIVGNNANGTSIMIENASILADSNVLTSQSGDTTIDLRDNAVLTGKFSLNKCILNIDGATINITGDKSDNRAIMINDGAVVNIKGSTRMQSEPLFCVYDGTVNITGGYFKGNIVKGLNYGDSNKKSVKDLLTGEYKLSEADDGWYQVVPEN